MRNNFTVGVAARRVAWSLPTAATLVAAEVLIAGKLWAAWHKAPGELTAGVGVTATAALVVLATMMLPLCCAHLTWMVTRAPRAAALAAILAAYFERLTDLVKHGVGAEVVPFGMMVVAIWLLAAAGGRRASLVVAAAAAVVMAAATILRPQYGLGFAVGALATCAVLMIGGAGRRQILAAVVYALILYSAIGHWGVTNTLLAVEPGGGPTSMLTKLIGTTPWPAPARAPVLAFVQFGEMAWRLGGVLAIVMLVYLRTSFRLALARRQLLRWCALASPLMPLITEAVQGGGRWYVVVTAVVPLIVIPAIIWRAL